MRPLRVGVRSFGPGLETFHRVTNEDGPPSALNFLEIENRGWARETTKGDDSLGKWRRT
jgi:hypothetical protein